jgi:uncharacterized protein YuzE
MSHSFPSVEVSEGNLSISFLDSTPSRSVEVSCVVDLTDFGDVIGVEVLDWRHQLSGGLLDAPRASGQVRWSYDEEIDALYVHVMDGRSQTQLPATAKVSLDSRQRVVCLEVPVPSATR